jgi:hypothetical protein
MAAMAALVAGRTTGWETTVAQVVSPQAVVAVVG